MKRLRTRHVFVYFLVIAALFATTTGAYAATGRQLADTAIAALKASAPGSTSKTVMATLSWSWLKVDYAYKTGEYTYPVTVDLLGTIFTSRTGTCICTRARGEHFPPATSHREQNLASTSVRQAIWWWAYPASDSAPGAILLLLCRTWGMDMHKKDIREVICTIESSLKKKLPR
jgi:hypothetical protein